VNDILNHDKLYNFFPGLIVSIAFLGFGITMILQPHRYKNTPSYKNLIQMESLTFWGICYLVIGIAWIIFMLWIRNDKVGLLVHTFASMITAVWVVIFIVRWITDSGTTIVNVINWGVLLTLTIWSGVWIDNVVSFKQSKHLVK